MTQTRDAFIETATNLDNLPDFVMSIARKAELLKIEVTTNDRNRIGSWFLGSITVPTLKRLGAGFGLPLFRGVNAEALERMQADIPETTIGDVIHFIYTLAIKPRLDGGS
jgi:hypothetical protein